MCAQKVTKHDQGVWQAFGVDCVRPGMRWAILECSPAKEWWLRSAAAQWRVKSWPWCHQEGEGVRE